MVLHHQKKSKMGHQRKPELSKSSTNISINNKTRNGPLLLRNNLKMVVFSTDGDLGMILRRTLSQKILTRFSSMLGHIVAMIENGSSGSTLSIFNMTIMLSMIKIKIQRPIRKSAIKFLFQKE